MCGRAYETYSDEELNIRYLNKRFPPIPDFLPTYNLCPTQNSPVLFVREGERQFTQMHWQLIPYWETAFKTSLSTINAKSETVFESGLFRDLILRRRCIVPLSGFYEWKKEGKRRRPFRICLANDEIMSVAGIWDVWHPGQEDERSSFSILTTSANELMRSLHDRMPVILARSDEEEWLDPSNRERARLERLLKPYAAAEMDVREVSPLVNSANNNGPELLEPYSAPPPERTLFD